jgi:transcriptional regulator with XRE-family HTH domain
MSIFWKNFYFLCEDKKTKPLRVVTELGIASGSITKWKNGAIPSGKSLQKLATHFGVTPEYFFVDHENPLSNHIATDEEDELWSKITQLDEIDRGKVDGFVSGLLAAEKYQEPTHLIKMAARAGGGIREVALTESQIEALKNLPEVPNLDDKK